MAPSRPKTGKDTPSPGKFLDDAETLLNVGKVDEAVTMAENALEATGPGGDFELRALNFLGIVSIEAGDIDEAKSYFEKAVKLDADGSMDEKIGGGPEKFLFLAELSEEGGQDSVTWFERGAGALRNQIQTLADITTKTTDQQLSLEEKQEKLGGVLCAVAEVYMTDLSWEEDAEQRCEKLVTEAMLVAPSSPETWQTVANVRISQERTDEAKNALKKSLEIWQDLPPEDPTVPPFPTRIALARLLLETDMMEDALTVLERLVTDDDESIEAWYLGGWGLFIAGEKLREANKDDDGWRDTWRSARRWLAQALKLYDIQEYEDDRLGEHAIELVQSINEEIGEPEEGEEDWDEESDEDDEDEEMQG